MNLRQLLRMARWARHPPSEARFKLVFGVIALCLVLFLADRSGLLPGWLSLEAPPDRPRIKPLP